MITGEVKVKVTPGELEAAADGVTQKLRGMRESLGSLEQIVARTKGYWIGEAGDLHRRLYEEERESVEEIMRRLEEHPVDLRMIACNYVTVEQKVRAVAESLPDDVIA